MTAPGRSLLLHPVALVALAVLIANDHWLKGASPGLITGKLSDVAGLVVAPLLLAEVASLALGPAHGRSPRTVALLAALVGGAFVLVKTTATGAALYAWGLGTVQWLVTLAWLRDETPLAVAIVRDPWDLIALASLVVAIRIAARPGPSGGPAPSVGSRRRQRLAGAALGLAAGVAALATSQAPPSAWANASAVLRLTSDEPTAGRRLEWTLDLAGAVAESVRIRATLGHGGAPPDGVEVVLVADDGSEAVMTYPGWVELRLPDGCRDWCRGGVLVVVHARPEAFQGLEALEIDLGVTATGDLRTEVEAAASVATATLAPVGDALLAPTALEAEAHGTVRLRVQNRVRILRFELRVDRAALDGDRWPLLGRIEAQVTIAEAINGFDTFGAALTVDGETTWIDGDGPGTVDWLRSCKPGADCRIPLKLKLVHESSPLDAAPEDVPRIVLDWTLVGRLEAFDGRPLPDGAIEIVELP